MKRINAVIRKEFKHIIRDKRSLGLLIMIPLFMLILFGYALNFNVTRIPIAVNDLSKSAESRLLVDKFVKSGYFVVSENPISMNKASGLMAAGKILVFMEIPHDFAHYLKKGEESKVGLFIDGVDSNTATAVISYTHSIIALFNEEYGAREITERGIGFRPRVWFNPELSSRIFLIPGLIVYILMIITVVSTSLTIVREREERTIEQLIVSPLGSIELILGKVVPYILITFFSALMILALGYIIFGVGVKGSLLLLLFSMMVFLLVGVAFGVLISAVADTRQFAFLIAVVFTILPTLLLSGFIFPIRNMALPIRILTYFVPARYFTVIIRNIYIKGVGFDAFWKEFLMMGVMAVALLAVSIKKLKAKLS